MQTQTCDPQKILTRLHKVEGQVRSIEKMYQEKREVEEIVRVVLAARASLGALTKMLINEKVHGCFDGKQITNKKDLEKLVDILFDVN
ncbi:metal-sensitive transcriptional regulator [Patescibacteria group bacterium]|nr:metal-sensitive transcriptional regulator [Patescibacteria group bacterium]